MVFFDFSNKMRVAPVVLRVWQTVTVQARETEFADCQTKLKPKKLA
jgi:hypothetical protein